MGPHISQQDKSQRPCPVSEWARNGQDTVCTQCYQVNDKSLRNKCLYCTMFALHATLDTTIVCIVKMSREKSLNAGNRSNLKS